MAYPRIRPCQPIKQSSLRSSIDAFRRRRQFFAAILL
jgi:hypothetical protein